MAAKHNVEPFGYTPGSFHPENTAAIEFEEALVVRWDLKDSTGKMWEKGAAFDACWEAQTAVLSSLSLGGCVPDITLPTGDGFILIFDMHRIANRPDVPFRRALRRIRPVLDAVMEYQGQRIVERPLTDKHGVVRHPGGPKVYGSTMLDGRFGIAAGMVEVHDCGSPLGPWIAPVGEPLFLAARLCDLAPDGGILMEADTLPVGHMRRAGLAKMFGVTREYVKPKGWPMPVEVWRLVPKA